MYLEEIFHGTFLVASTSGNMHRFDFITKPVGQLIFPFFLIHIKMKKIMCMLLKAMLEITRGIWGKENIVLWLKHRSLCLKTLIIQEASWKGISPASEAQYFCSEVSIFILTYCFRISYQTWCHIESPAEASLRRRKWLWALQLMGNRSRVGQELGLKREGFLGKLGSRVTLQVSWPIK